ncbi:MAG: helix-turn-helix domain-containing protein [Fimbriimonas sp.]
MKTAERPVGELLKAWRQRRRLSQLDFSLEAEVSSRHLSFIETGRSQPSREMLLHLAERLDVPLRERNVLLITAGYAPAFPERALEDPALFPARQAVGLVLKGHEPYPALAIDRHWQIVAHNDAVPPLLAGLPERWLTPPINVLRLSLHPEGLAPRIENLGEWRTHLMERLRRQIAATGDKALVELQTELETFPAPEGPSAPNAYAGMVVPLRLRTPNGVLSMFSTTMVFGTPQDVTLSELAIESFFPADEATARAFTPKPM